MLLNKKVTISCGHNDFSCKVDHSRYGGSFNRAGVKVNNARFRAFI
jgi:hypothetical protein